MKTVAILPLKLLSLILVLTPAASMAVTELSDHELNQAAAKTNAPQIIVKNAVIRDQAQVCAEPEAEIAAALETSDEFNEASSSPESGVERCEADPRLAANDPLNNQPAEQFYGNLSGTLQSNREFLEQNPYSGNVLNSPSLDPTTSLPSDQYFQRARDLTLQLGESLQRMNMEP